MEVERDRSKDAEERHLYVSCGNYLVINTEAEF